MIATTQRLIVLLAISGLSHALSREAETGDYNCPDKGLISVIAACGREKKMGELCGCSGRIRMYRKRSQPLHRIRIGALESITEKHRRSHGKFDFT